MEKELTIEELFDKVHQIESENDFYFRMDNKPGYGHVAEFYKNESQCVASSEFCEFRAEAIEDLIFKIESGEEVF